VLSSVDSSRRTRNNILNTRAAAAEASKKGSYSEQAISYPDTHGMGNYGALDASQGAGDGSRHLLAQLPLVGKCVAV